MKWFKHISDSLDDPFISTLIEKFGALGYLIFFGTLEIYAREFKPEPCWKCVISLSFLCRKCVQTRKKRVIEILTFIHASHKWEVNIQGKEIIINIPKFKDLLDKWTEDKVRRTSKQLLSNLPATSKQLTPKEVEVDKDIYIKEVKEKTDSDESFDTLFEKFWKEYPKKVSKKDAYKSLKKLTPDLEDIEALINQIHKQHVPGGILDPKENGKYIYYPATWLNKELWRE